MARPAALAARRVGRKGCAAFSSFEPSSSSLLLSSSSLLSSITPCRQGGSTSRPASGAEGGAARRAARRQPAGRAGASLCWLGSLPPAVPTWQARTRVPAPQSAPTHQQHVLIVAHPLPLPPRAPPLGLPRPAVASCGPPSCLLPARLLLLLLLLALVLLICRPPCIWSIHSPTRHFSIRRSSLHCNRGRRVPVASRRHISLLTMAARLLLLLPLLIAARLAIVGHGGATQR